MTKITFIQHTGQSRTLDAPAGASVMQVAVQNQTPGIDAECGGACSCATCHVYVDEAWRAKLLPPPATALARSTHGEGSLPAGHVTFWEPACCYDFTLTVATFTVTVKYRLHRSDRTSTRSDER